jgi:hypothetical protein
LATQRLIASLGPVRQYFVVADEVAKATFEKGESLWATGDQLLFFLRIDELLRFYLSGVLVNWSEEYPHFMWALFEGREPIYLRAWLLKVCTAVSRLGSEVVDFEMIRKWIVTEEHLQALKRLLDLFGFKQDILE